MPHDTQTISGKFWRRMRSFDLGAWGPSCYGPSCAFVLESLGIGGSERCTMPRRQTSHPESPMHPSWTMASQRRAPALRSENEFGPDMRCAIWRLRSSWDRSEYSLVFAEPLSLSSRWPRYTDDAPHYALARRLLNAFALHGGFNWIVFCIVGTTRVVPKWEIIYPP